MTVVCAWCGEAFTPPATKGPVPRFCRQSHRQRAYEERRLARAVDAATTTTGGILFIPKELADVIDVPDFIARLRADAAGRGIEVRIGGPR